MCSVRRVVIVVLMLGGTKKGWVVGVCLELNWTGVGLDCDDASGS